MIITVNRPGRYWLNYFRPGEFVNGEEVTVPTFALCLAKEFSDKLPKEVAKITQHPFDLQLPFGINERGMFSNIESSKGFGFGRVGKNVKQQDTNIRIILFEPARKSKDEHMDNIEKIRRNWQNIFWTLSLVASTAEKHKESDVPEERQDLCWNFSTDKDDSELAFKISCLLGPQISLYLRYLASDYVFYEAQSAMKQVAEHISEGSTVLNRPFNAFAGGEGGITLHFPYGGVFKTAEGNPKVIISENIKMFDQFFALIAGIATLHKQFRSANYTYFY